MHDRIESCGRRMPKTVRRRRRCLWFTAGALTNEYLESERVGVAEPLSAGNTYSPASLGSVRHRSPNDEPREYGSALLAAHNRDFHSASNARGKVIFHTLPVNECPNRPVSRRGRRL